MKYKQGDMVVIWWKHRKPDGSVNIWKVIKEGTTLFYSAAMLEWRHTAWASCAKEYDGTYPMNQQYATSTIEEALEYELLDAYDRKLLLGLI